MANKLLGTFDPGRIIIVFNGVQIQGYAPDTFVKISRDNDSFDDEAGAAGDVVRIASRDRRGNIEITLLNASPSNDILSGFVSSDEDGGVGMVGSALVKDLNSTARAEAAEAWIKKPSDLGYGSKAENTTWIIRCANLTLRPGGNVR